MCCNYCAYNGQTCLVDSPMRGEFNAYKYMDYSEDKYGINLREEVKIYV